MFIGEPVGIIPLITTTVDTIHITIRITAVTVQQPGTIRLPEHSDEVVGLMDRMVVSVMVHVTIRQQEHMRVVQQLMDLMARVVMQKHTILELVPLQERDKEATNMASWGSSAVRRGDDWVKSGHYRDRKAAVCVIALPMATADSLDEKVMIFMPEEMAMFTSAPIAAGKAGTTVVGIM